MLRWWDGGLTARIAAVVGRELSTLPRLGNALRIVSYAMLALRSIPSVNLSEIKKCVSLESENNNQLEW